MLRLWRAKKTARRRVTARGDCCTSARQRMAGVTIGGPLGGWGAPLATRTAPRGCIETLKIIFSQRGAGGERRQIVTKTKSFTLRKGAQLKKAEKTGIAVVVDAVTAGIVLNNTQRRGIIRHPAHPPNHQVLTIPNRQPICGSQHAHDSADDSSSHTQHQKGYRLCRENK